jgi:uncharacterized Zn finger protein
MREDAYTRGVRLLSNGRLVVERIDGHVIEARVRGDHGEIHRLGYRPGEWHCSCAARTWCAHLVALTLVTVRPGSSGDAR